jgi:hypothetical protein
MNSKYASLIYYIHLICQCTVHYSALVYGTGDWHERTSALWKSRQPTESQPPLVERRGDAPCGRKLRSTPLPPTPHPETVGHSAYRSTVVEGGKG